LTLLPKVILDPSTVTLGDEPLPAPCWHFAHQLVRDDAFLAAAEDEPLQDGVGGRNVDRDFRHEVVDALETNSHLVNRNDEASEERLEKFAHGFVGLLVH